VNRDPADGEHPPVSTAAGLSRPVAAAIGVLSAWLALGAGHLAAGLFAAGSSPYLAVGDAVVRLSPQALTEFAKATFGTSDKAVLLVGMFVVITVIAAAAGLASRWHRQPGMAVLGAMGVLGGLAVVSGPAFTQSDLLAPLVAVVAGVGAFAVLHGLGLRAAAGTDPSRRTALLAGGAALGLGALAAAGGGVLPRSFRAARDDVTAQLARALYVERAAPPPASAEFAAFTMASAATSG